MSILFDLQLFADGAAAAAEGSSTDGVASVESEGTATEVAETTEAPVAEETFDDLIKGKYKADFDKKMQAAIKRRLGDTKAMEAELAKARETLAIAQQRYGTKDGDWDALTNALIEDDQYLEKEAYEKGIDKDTLRAMKRMEHENEQLKRNQAELERRAREEQAFQKLMAEQAEVREIYPLFNIDVEAQNPKFEQLVRNGIDLKTAYEVVHHGEILPTAMKIAADKAKEEAAQTVRSNLSRPSELGAGSTNSPAGKVDVSKLSREERDKINQRVMAGERIVL